MHPTSTGSHGYGRDGRAGSRRAAAVGRSRPAVPYRLRGDAARTADDAGGAAGRRGHAGGAPAGGASGRRAAGGVHAAHWDETDDPTAARRRLAGRARTVAVGDQMWARFLVELLRTAGRLVPPRRRRRGPLRMVKDAPRSTRCAPRVPPSTASPPSSRPGRSAGRPHRGRGSADLSARLLAEGHDMVNFAIVAAGANAASPHHHAGDRVIHAGEIVLCDFGGTMDGYCSDITRCVFMGGAEPPAEVVEAYAVLHEAQQAGVAAASSAHRARRSTGSPEGSSPPLATASTSSTAPATASAWRSTRIPTWSRATPAAGAGHAFSVEPGIYVPGVGGCASRHRGCHRRRARALNGADHALVVVEA